MGADYSAIERTLTDIPQLQELFSDGSCYWIDIV